jgi:release factor glutamine methyltransferase
MFISEALFLAENILKQQGVNSYRIDALLLLCYCLSFTKEQVIFNSKFTLSLQQQQDFFSLIRRRSNREPISHIVGCREFFGIEFTVDSNVLDPRPDSEALIELVLERIVDKKSHLNILELGVGSGCLILAILKNFPNSFGVGVDISDKALNIARQNSVLLDLSGRVKFLESDWFSSLKNDTDLKNSFDLIISNPPYIPTNDIKFLQKEVRVFEPKLALDGGESGLDCYLQIAKDVKSFLKKDGILVLEIGQNQEQDIIRIFEGSGLKFVISKKDLAGIVRCLMFKL